VKAVIVEIKNKHAAALYDDGSIVRVANQNYEIGQVVYLKNESNNRFKQKMVAMAVVVAAVVSTAGATAYAYNDPYSYVSLDVNPSIAYTVNRFDKVLKADGINEDGKKVLSNIELKGKNINDAVRETLNEISNEGFFMDDGQGGVVIATYSENEDKSGELQDAIQDGAQDQLNQDGVQADLEIMGVGRERVLEAQELEAQGLEVTPGKLNLIEKLQASTDDPDSIVITDWIDRPVKDIMKQIKENKKEDKLNGTTDTGDENEAAPTGSPATGDQQQNLQTQSQPSESAVNGKEKDKDKDKDKDKGKNSSGEAAAPTASATQSAGSAPSETANANSNKDKQNDTSEKGNGQQNNDKGNNGNKNK
jgi:hypothetical protein